MNHPYPVGTPCIIISTERKSDEDLIGRFCEVVYPLNMYPVTLPGYTTRTDYGYGVKIKGIKTEYFTKPRNILAIKPDDDFLESEESIEDFMISIESEQMDEQCVIIR